MTYNEFETASMKDKIDYMKSVLNQIKYDDEGLVTNLYGARLRDNDPEFMPEPNPIFNWFWIYYEIIEE